MKPKEPCTRREDEAFGEMIRWLKKNGLQAHTRKGEVLLIVNRQKRVKRS